MKPFIIITPVKNLTCPECGAPIDNIADVDFVDNSFGYINHAGRTLTHDPGMEIKCVACGETAFTNADFDVDEDWGDN